MGQFSTNHSATIIFVVKLQALQEVFDGAGILVFLDLAVDGQELIDLDFLFTCNYVKIVTAPKALGTLYLHLPFFLVPPNFSTWARVGFKLRARRTSPK